MSEYEKYQLQWMLAHGYSLRSLIAELTEMQLSDPEDGDRISTPVSNFLMSGLPMLGSVLRFGRARPSGESVRVPICHTQQSRNIGEPLYYISASQKKPLIAKYSILRLCV